METKQAGKQRKQLVSGEESRKQSKPKPKQSEPKPKHSKPKPKHPDYMKFKRSLGKHTNTRQSNTFQFKQQHEREDLTYARFHEFAENERIATSNIEGSHSVSSVPTKLVESTATKFGKACNDLGGFQKLGEPFSHRIDYKQYVENKEKEAAQMNSE